MLLLKASRLVDCFRPGAHGGAPADWGADDVPMNHFANGWISPVAGYVFSFLGSLLSLVFAARAREATGGRRIRLLLVAAGTLGTTGIWLMHFVAMLCFEVPTLSMRYNVPLTAFSLLLAIVVVGFGLLVVGLGRLTAWRILLGGPLTGIGVAGMHYSGMAAIDMHGVIAYNRPLFLLSVGIAVVAATAALSLAMLVKSASATVLAALAMAFAVSSMHYTGMAAARVTAIPNDEHALSGASPFTLLVPIVVLAGLLLCGLFYAMAGMSLNDRHNDLSRIDDAAAVPAGATLTPHRAPVIPPRRGAVAFQPRDRRRH
jgi:NO-binding membrane sensor protein with MHYT domain